MVCARLMHKKNTSKDCDRRDSNDNDNNNNNNNKNYNNDNDNNNNNDNNEKIIPNFIILPGRLWLIE